MSNMQNKVPVLIVGAGPTGLSMAVELYRYNIPFRIIDADIKPVTTSSALAIQPRTLEMWDDISFLPRVLDKGVKIEGFTLYAGQKKLGMLNTSGMDTMHPYLLGIAQSETETLLHTYLQEKSITVELQTKLSTLIEKDNGVEVTLINKDGLEENLEVDWLLACDGGHSPIRELLHIPFEGKDLPQHFVMGDMELVSDLPKNRSSGFFSHKGICMMVPFDKKHFRVLFEVSNEPELRAEKNPTPAQLKGLMKERCPFPIEIKDTIWTSGFWVHERIIPNYRHNRIFFAGDAAHIHSPAGGQGMNMGIQDAYNLIWKLASVIKGIAKADILETYNEERRPIAQEVLARSSLMTTTGTSNNKFIYYLRNFLTSWILKTKLAIKMLSTNSQLLMNYRESKLSLECIKHSPGPQAGDRVLDCWLDNSKTNRLLTYIRGTEPCIVFFTGIQRENRLPKLVDIQKELSNKFAKLFRYLVVAVHEEDNQSLPMEVIRDAEQKVHRKYQVNSPTIYFFRPDKYIGFRGKISDADALMKYLGKFYY